MSSNRCKATIVIAVTVATAAMLVLPGRALTTPRGAQVPSLTQATADLQQKAQAGDAKAQVQLGVKYLTGDGLAADDTEAAKWFHKAADQDDAFGERYLGEMYASGRGVVMDNAEAAKWLRLAAEQNDAHAQHNLAVMYLQGLGVPKNVNEAAKWMRSAADQGLTDGQFGLGVLYENGYGVSRDPAEAMKWYRKAAEGGNVQALNNLAFLLATVRDTNIHNPTEAIVLAAKAVAADAKNSEYLDTLAAAYYEAAKFDAAVDTEKKAVALAPDDASYKQALAKYLGAAAGKR